jgi:4-hydroxybenzoate polyprenyltransferase
VSAVLELLAYSSLVVALAASALCAAAGRVLGADPTPATLVIAAAGTLFIYNVDRLRDVERDRATSPHRTAFVERWRPALLGLAGASAAAAAVLALRAGPRVVIALAPIAVLGLAHRRLKQFAWWKPFYVSGAWTAVVVGLPAAMVERVRDVPWIAAIVSATIAANVIASNLRDQEAPAARFGARVPLQIARGLVLGAAAFALLAPGGVQALVPIPLATLAALAAFRPTELYGLIAVDGALLVGALASLAIPSS